MMPSATEQERIAIEARAALERPQGFEQIVSDQSILTAARLQADCLLALIARLRENAEASRKDDEVRPC